MRDSSGVYHAGNQNYPPNPMLALEKSAKWVPAQLSHHLDAFRCVVLTVYYLGFYAGSARMYFQASLVK